MDATEEKLKVTKTQCGGKITFALSGRLETVTAPVFQTELIAAFDAAGFVELNLDGLVYVSSAGLRVLLLGEKTAKSKNASMTLSNVSQDIREVFDMTGFSDILNIV
jgi:anti-anti-sigma factor